MQKLTRKLTREEADNISKWLWNWLDEYVQEVIDYIFENKIDEIINNEVVLKMLETLYKYETDELEDCTKYISNALYFESNDTEISYWSKNLKSLKRHFMLKDPTQYRGVLYDLYIKDMPNEEA